MKYKTIIEVTSDARNNDEAIYIAGEYLRGNIESGVEIRCKSHPNRAFVLTGLTISLALAITAIFISSIGICK
ncbi:MAG: hypothetical protein ABID09_00360 [Candidatus Omnitrophota bacterium]